MNRHTKADSNEKPGTAGVLVAVDVAVDVIIDVTTGVWVAVGVAVAEVTLKSSVII